MANKTLFKSYRGKQLPAAETTNRAGGNAYRFSAQHALAQYVATGCMGQTFYATAEMQLDTVLTLARDVSPDFLAKCAVYGRTHGYMKDMPALLLAVLSTRDAARCEKIAPRVLDNGKMLRNFVQILRSGVTGRKSLGTVPKRIVRDWLASHSDEAVFRASVGNDPSIADIVKMVHPRPSTKSRDALYAYLLGRDYQAHLLPGLVRQFEAWKADMRGSVPDVPFQLLAGQELTTREWTEIARHARWQMTRMNLNTFARHGVFEDQAMTKLIANRLRNPEQIKRAQVFPYQLLAAYLNAADRAGVLKRRGWFFGAQRTSGKANQGKTVPRQVIEALQDAMEIAVNNVPTIPGKVAIAVDVSGSMSMSISGWRATATSAVRCVDVAGLIAAAVLRHNPQAIVLPFESDVVHKRINPRDSIMTNAKRLADLNGGGTNCSAPLRWLNDERRKVDLVLMVSDNESWVDKKRYGATETMEQWNLLKTRNKNAKLICLDLVPNQTTQAKERDDILNIGGFSDTVFDLIALFAADKMHPRHWLQVIDKINP